MNDKLAKAEDEISNLQRILAEKDNIIEMQRKELSDKYAKVETLKAAKDILEKDANSMKEQLVVLKEKVSELQQDIFNPRSFVNCLQGKNQKLQQDLENLQRQVIQGQQELKKLQTKYDETVGELTTKQQIMKGNDRAPTQQSSESLQLDEERREHEAMKQSLLTRCRVLEEQLKQKEDECERLSQNKKCGNTCVLDLIVWIYNFIGGSNLSLCDRGLERYLSYLTAHSQNITLQVEDLKCTNLMKILEKLGVVEEYARFDYPPPENDPFRTGLMAKLFDAWRTILGMHNSERSEPNVVLLGRVGSQPNGEGHCVLSLLSESNKRLGGEITIYDPQRKVSREYNGTTVKLEDFKNDLKHDKGLRLYTVNTVTLREIFYDYSKIHVPSCRY